MAVDRISDNLPERYSFSHDFAFTLHDTLVGYIVDGTAAGMFQVETSIEDLSEGEFPRDDEHAFDWLERIDRGDVLGDVLHRTIFAAVLGDACHFLYEALRCVEKGKLTVAYALLRKPLKESLYYLEMLLGAPDELLNTFWLGETTDLAMGRVARREKATEIIGLALSRCVNGKMYDAEFLFDARFNKGAAWGLDPYWNKAIHLITDRPSIRTERQNLNFVFSESEAVEDQWNHLYGLLPFILYYMVDVSTSLMLHFVTDDDLNTDWGLSILHRTVGFLVWAHDSRDFRSSEATLRQLSDPGLVCPHCGYPIPAERELLVTLYEDGEIPCQDCREVFNLRSIHEAA